MSDQLARDIEQSLNSNPALRHMLHDAKPADKRLPRSMRELEYRPAAVRKAPRHKSLPGQLDLF